MSIRVSELHYYPVKSLKGLHVDHIHLDEFGFQNDRRYMLIDSSGKFVTQRQYPLLSQVSAQVTGNGIEITGSDFPRIGFEVDDFVETKTVGVWNDQVQANYVPEALNSLSSTLGFEVYVAHMPESAFRQVDRDFFAHDQRVSFADAFPILLTNKASLDDLNARIEHRAGLAVPMKRFRPNIVIEGADAFAEDRWQQIRIGEVIFECVKPCSRCVMTTIDDQAQKNKEPLATLATYRKNEFGVCFGENLVHRSKGLIRVGDTLEILS